MKEPFKGMCRVAACIKVFLVANPYIVCGALQEE